MTEYLLKLLKSVMQSVNLNGPWWLCSLEMFDFCLEFFR